MRVANATLDSAEELLGSSGDILEGISDVIGRFDEEGAEPNGLLDVSLSSSCDISGKATVEMCLIAVDGVNSALQIQTADDGGVEALRLLSNATDILNDVRNNDTPSPRH